MNDFDPTQNRVQTCLLTADELAALKAAKHGWEFWCADKWINSTGPSWQTPDFVYRAKPAPAPSDKIAEAARVLVKPLVWTKAMAGDGSSMWVSDFDHKIRATALNTFIVIGSANEFGQRQDALDFAQHLHNKRILSALTTRPDPQPAADTRVVTVEQLQRWGDNFHAHTRSGKEIRAIIGNATPAPSDKIAEAARAAHEALWELNPDNYNHDDVLKLNDASIEAIFLLADAIGETHGKTPEWWEARRRALAGQGETP